MSKIISPTGPVKTTPGKTTPASGSNPTSTPAIKPATGGKPSGPASGTNRYTTPVKKYGK